MYVKIFFWLKYKPKIKNQEAYMKYIITTDSNCDLPETFYKDNNIPVLPICYYMDGVIYGKRNTLPLSEFYNRMRNGESAKTAAPNIAETKAFFEDCIKVCKNILPPRGVTASGFPPLCNIPHCCLP